VEDQKRKLQEEEDMIKRGPNINKRSQEQVKVNQQLADKNNNIKGIYSQLKLNM